ncbi:MAG: DUF4160 domain-containing protein [bacterium]|nr:DUF4160 domain-containing protein [bacterium]
MPEISRFFGIVIRMCYDQQEPPHLHAEFKSKKALLDFEGNVFQGDLESVTALKLVREWISQHIPELQENWELTRAAKAVKSVPPLD